MSTDDPEALKRKIAELQALLAKAEAAGGASTTDSAIASDGSAAIVIQGSVFGNVSVQTGSGPSPRQLLAHYLRCLMADCQRLKLDVIDEKSTVQGDASLRLSAVYTNLLVTATEQEVPMDGNMHWEKKEQLSASAFASRHPLCVILGNPGAGKSTFTDFLCLCLAGQISGHPEVNLSLLDYDWRNHILLPLRIVLREYAALSLPQGHSLWQHLGRGWKDALEGFGDPLRRHLIEQGGLLVLDGLDEVPEASGCRDKVKAAILAFRADFPNVRILVTSRTYAYLHQQWRLPDFVSTELAPFEEEQWNAFIEKWYAELATIRRQIPMETARVKTTELQQSIADRPHLKELASNPLLLTLMASLHSLRGGTLPRERERLYDESVSLLMDAWERPKTVYQDGKPLVISASAQEFLKLTARADIEKAIAKLAYQVHASQGHQAGVADISEGNLLAALNAISKDTNPALLAEYVRDRAGLLTHHGEGVYRFPHRTFQEYLAARDLADMGPDEIARHVREDPGRWREAYLLAGAKVARGAQWAAWDIVRKTCPKVPHKNAKDIDWLCASLAAQLLVETELATASDDAIKIRKTIVDALVKLVTSGKLDPVERARAGAALGNLGDPRPGVGLKNGLPDFDWVGIPVGEFLYGNVKETRTIQPAYHISRYPVTVGQYRAFFEAGGYSEDRWWDADGIQWRKAENITGPETYREIFQTPNHPQVGLSFHEAAAFCRWASAQGIGSIRLASEEEWERAARGTDGREYPWGGADKVENHANIDGTDIGYSSAAGIFPNGASPDNCLDMVGNVWEWTTGKMDRYSVVRGSSFGHPSRFARCAYRNKVHPVSRYDRIGFRVVAPSF